MSEDYECRVIQNDVDRLAARAIVKRAYEAQGYGTGSRIAQYLQGPDAITFGLIRDDTLYGTISVVVDSEQGLPMDTIYADELALWRSLGKKLAEVVQFAVDHELYSIRFGKKPSLFSATQLFAATLSCAFQRNIDYLCISINPKHDRFYRMLGFKQIGARKQYESVGAPAIAYAFYVPEWNRHRNITGFFGTEILKHMAAQRA